MTEGYIVLCRSKDAIPYLVDELPAVLVGFNQHRGPQLRVAPLHQVTCLALEQGVLIAHLKGWAGVKGIVKNAHHHLRCFPTRKSS